MRHARDFAVTVLVLGVLGVVAGVLWSMLAPRPPYVMTGQGPLLADPSTQALIAGDGLYALVTGVIGLACGAVGYTLSRRGRPLAIVVGLATGGLLGAYLATLIGGTINLAPAPVVASGNSVSLFPGPLALTAKGFMFAWPTLAVGLFFALEGIAGYRDSPLRTPFGGQDPYGPLSGYDISGR
ncbi:hypothetical protein ACFY19_08090 [Streptosporangium saharense]|uniref:hypothetical protein n=1 Tax=Streptosporangium saharense TaxID=1706840 RepID=UPI003697E407